VLDRKNFSKPKLLSINRKHLKVNPTKEEKSKIFTFRERRQIQSITFRWKVQSQPEHFEVIRFKDSFEHIFNCTKPLFHSSNFQQSSVRAQCHTRFKHFSSHNWIVSRRSKADFLSVSRN